MDDTWEACPSLRFGFDETYDTPLFDEEDDDDNNGEEN